MERTISSHAKLHATADTPRRLLPAPAQRVMTRAECEALFKRVVALTTGGGDTQVSIRGAWTGNIRWARNRPTTSGDTITFTAQITRMQPGKEVTAVLDKLDDATLKEAVQLLEQRLSVLQAGTPNPPLGPQTYLTSAIWDDATFAMTPKDLSDAARMSIDPVVDAKLDAAGYAEVGAATWAIFNTRGLAAHAIATGAMYAETVRNMEGTASGWTGKSHMAWDKLGVSALSKTALQKCRDSANPVQIEPGRYTTILEPKAVANLMSSIFNKVSRPTAEEGGTAYSIPGQRKSKIGLQIFDKRITITSDPADPDCGYIPFDPAGHPYQRVTWVENGILKELPYDQTYARKSMGTDAALVNPMAFRIHGGDTSIEEMIATTERGLYVTHFGLIANGLFQDPSVSSVTRDGSWLIEHGKIVHPIRNLWIYDAPMAVFNQVLQVGPAVRTIGVSTWQPTLDGVIRELPAQALNDGYVPIVAPTIKVRDFNFTRISEAV